MRTTWQRLLERLASGDHVLCADDVRGWPKSDLDHAVSLGVLREAEAATSILCDACDERHWSEVVWVAGGRRAFIACPHEGPVTVELNRLRQWRFDATRLAGLVSEALELSGPVQPIELGRLWHLGRRRLAGRFRDLFLAVAETATVGGAVDKVLRHSGWTSGVLFVPDGLSTEVPSKLRLIGLAAVSDFSEGRLSVDLDYVADSFADAGSPQKPHVQGIPAPVGISWTEVAIVLYGGFMQVTVRGKQFERDFVQAGFREPDQRLELLKLFAAARGTLDAGRISSLLVGSSPPKTRVSRLRMLLQDLIDVDGDPIEHQKKANTYCCGFDVRLARDDGYPTPAGATWLDFTFHERADSRLLVSVAETRRFRARGQQSEDGRATGEVAEQSAPAGRLYSLEELRLRTPAGKLTAEGTAFVRLLRTGGRLPRRGDDDLIVLGLAKLLREWTGVEEEPLQLSDATRSWTALFACSSEIKSTK